MVYELQRPGGESCLESFQWIATSALRAEDVPRAAS